MTVSPADAAALVLGAAGIAPGEVPPRRFGADWFREQPDWLAMATAADRLVCDPGFDPSAALAVAGDLLAEDLDHETRQLLEVGFVESLVCSASHATAEATDRIIAASPQPVWSVWHRRRERLEALSEQRVASSRPPRALEDDDRALAMLARCTTYRAESGRFVLLADLISADRPSPWPLRHPVLLGLAFAAVMVVLLVLSLL